MDAPVNLEGLAGRSLLHYLVQKKIGCGGMGVVYEALDTRLGRKVALKFLPPELAENRDALRRFRREAQAASALPRPASARRRPNCWPQKARRSWPSM